MTVTVSAMFIPVHDPDAALGFYRDALGLEVRADVASEGFRWVTVGAPGQDVDIVLSQPHGGRSQAEGDALLSLVTAGVAAGCDLPLRRPRHHLREGSSVGRRGAPGAGVPALGRARLRVPRPLGQPRPHRAGLTVVAAAGRKRAPGGAEARPPSVPTPPSRGQALRKEATDEDHDMQAIGRTM